MATSPTSTSSFDFLSSAPASSDDEVIYPQESSDDSSSDSGPDNLLSDSDDDDFVVLSRARSPCRTGILSPSGESTFSTDDVISSAMSSMSMSQSSAAAFIRDAVSLRLGVGRSSAAILAPAAPTSQAITPPVSTKTTVKPVLTEAQKEQRRLKRRAKLARRRAREAVVSVSDGRFPVVDDASSVASQQPSDAGLTKGQRRKARKALRAAIAAAPHRDFPIVDDASSIVDDTSSIADDTSSVASEDSTTSTATVTGYEDASSFITGYLSSPDNKDTACKLTLLHSLIVELGVADASSLPSTVTQAKKLLKAEAHINIREYMAEREKGQDALKRIMHASRGSLVKSIRKKKNPASLTWVKQQGLNVLLVQCFC
ncbi:hypothetical protein HWV62_1484 [Athelia sp. TMB]|nr:hypothetical protein HWV62_1484 [Athelia sp. TMB]